MPFLKFGKKRDKEEDDDLEVEEESGLLMSTKGEQPVSTAESGPAPASPQPSDALDPGAADGQTAGAEAPGGEAGAEGDPLLAAALADPLAEDESAGEASAETGNSEKSDAADLMAAFQTDEASSSDLTDLLVGVDVVAASALLEELREIRSMLPPAALDQGGSAT